MTNVGSITGREASALLHCTKGKEKGEGKTGRSAEIKSRRAKEKGHCHVKKFSNALIDFLCGYY